MRRSQRLQSQPGVERQRQASLSTWLLNPPQQSNASLNPDNLTQDLSIPVSDDKSDSETDSDTLGNHGIDDGIDVSTANMTDLLLDIRKDVKLLNKKFDSMERTVKGLKKDNKLLKQQNESLSNQVTVLNASVSNLELRTKETERKNEQLEAQSRRENLKFYGIDDDKAETWDQSESKIREYLSNELELDVSNMKIERAHRLPSQSSPRPIIVKFSHFKDKDLVLKTYRQKRKEKQNVATIDSANDTDGQAEFDTNPERPVRVSEDFPMRVTKVRAKLYPFLKSCHENEKEAYLRYDMLVVDGQSYTYDFELGRPVPIK
ncbi:MAG: hypothetical protein AB2693_25145 [Candidatus Thiodiazotropha sp.]